MDVEHVHFAGQHLEVDVEAKGGHGHRHEGVGEDEEGAATDCVNQEGGCTSCGVR